MGRVGTPSPGAVPRRRRHPRPPGRTRRARRHSAERPSPPQCRRLGCCRCGQLRGRRATEGSWPTPTVVCGSRAPRDRAQAHGLTTDGTAKQARQSRPRCRARAASFARRRVALSRSSPKRAQDPRPASIRQQPRVRALASRLTRSRSHDCSFQAKAAARLGVPVPVQARGSSGVFSLVRSEAARIIGTQSGSRTLPTVEAAIAGTAGTSNARRRSRGIVRCMRHEEAEISCTNPDCGVHGERRI